MIAFSELFLTFAYKKVAAYLLGDGVLGDGLLQLLSTDYKFAVSFFILVIVLLIRPTGSSAENQYEFFVKKILSAQLG